MPGMPSGKTEPPTPSAEAFKPLEAPTRSAAGASEREKFVGFLAASVFSAIYVIAPLYLVVVFVRLLQAPLSPSSLVLCLPLVASLLLPQRWLPPFGMWLLRQYPLLCIPKYFDFEEYAEFTDREYLELHEAGKRTIACIHPHGVFPFVSVCAAVNTVSRADGLGAGLMDVPTAAASVIRLLPLLKDIIGIFGIVDASAKVLGRRLLRRKGSCVIYVVGLIELFKSTPTRETVFLKKRKGFVKVALRTGADLIPIYSFGNTTCLEALKWGPLASLSRKLGVSVTLFWGRFGLPVPKKVKLVYARGRPLGLPHIPNPTDADVDKYHQLYCEKLVALFDNYKKFNPDYADKTLHIE